MISVGRCLVVLACVVVPLEAFGHAYLVSSEPPHKAELPAAPPRLRLQFSEPIEPAFVNVSLSRDGKPVTGPLKPSTASDARTVFIESRASAAGTYQLDWSIVARDGHRTKGNLTFTVKPR